MLLGVALGTYALLFWPFDFLFYAAFRGDDAFLDVAPQATALFCAVAAGFLTWQKLSSRTATSAPLGLAWCVFIGAILFGGIGFCLGLFVAGVFYPESNLSGMYPIFITGPGGVICGGTVGLFYWYIRNHNAHL